MNTLSKSKFFTDTRVTGLLYLGIALTGMFAFLFAKSTIYVDGDALATAANLVEKETLARAGIALELALVAFQAFAALWFYKTFTKVNSFAAGMLATFGMINAVVILTASAMWFSALNASLANDSATIVYSVFSIHESLWLVGNLFFGLWLIPMGYLAMRANMPRALAGVLVIGGIGYILSAVVLIMFPTQVTLGELLPLPATIGEFWMIGYLLFKPQLNKADGVL